MARLTSTFALTLMLATSLASLAQAADTATKKSPVSNSQSRASQPEVPTTTPTKSDAAVKTKTNTNKKDQAAESQDKVFVPSEEISEDFAVSFPVDI